MGENVKEVYVKSDLVKMGYPQRLIEELKYSKDLPEFGFKHGRTTYFYLDDLKEYLKEREKKNDRVREGFRFTV